MIEHILEPAFGGTIGRTVDESTPWWPRRDSTGDRAPNVVVIVLDDVGFAQLGCYGSDIATPAVDALAAGGLRYTNFHVTPLCSPTRACLLTGRNHHSVGMGMICGFPSGFPNGRERVSHRAAMLPAALSAADYASYGVGKWHLLPMADMTPAGRFDHWPLAHGFDRFYGFLAGETDQYRPNLVSDNSVVTPPDRPGYHLSEDLVDAASEMLASHRSATPDRPFFLYLAFGACHGPHQVPEPYRSRYRGAYDDGWDVVRQRWYERQLATGVIPEGTALAPRNPGLVAWDDLPHADRALFARYQEVFAGFLEHTDEQIGRLMATLAALDCAADTLTLVMSDNGAAGEGGNRGSWNELIPFNGLSDAEAAALEGEGGRIDGLGGAGTYPIYPAAWAQVGNTPCKWFKHHTFGGGVRAPLVVHWPGRVAEPGGFRRAFHHAIDVTPTVLDAAGAVMPDVVHGVPQLPLHGRSMLDGVLRPEVPDRPRTQYFEMGGHRGIYHDGWKAVTLHAPGADYATEQWELYRIEDDFSETRDLATERPELVEELRERWWLEAGRFGVTPLDDRFLERAQDRRGTDAEGRTRFTYYRGTRRVSESAAAEVRGGRFSLSIPLEGFDAAHEGVLVSFGGRHAGFVVYVRAGHVHVDVNRFGDVGGLVSTSPLPAGDHDLRLDWEGLRPARR
jgi:arylsulfatase